MGSDHWGTAIPELYSIADAREARFLGEYVLNTAFRLERKVWSYSSGNSNTK